MNSQVFWGKKLATPKEIDIKKGYFLQSLEIEWQKIELIKKVFQSNNQDFVMDILIFEGRKDLLHDNHFDKSEDGVFLKEKSLNEIKQFI